ncbi:MAG: HAD-IA family hydrolase [Terracidiphilus sp.]
MFPFDAILFDVGKVLLTNGWDHNHRALLAEHFGLDFADFEARHMQFFDEWERDIIPLEAYLDRTVFYQPRSFSRDDYYALMLAQSELIPDSAMGILQELAASRPCLLGALNNEARELNEYRFRRFGLNDLFDVAFSSCYVGLRKPDPAIYRRALDILSKPAERVLFIDDRMESIAGAAAAGMKTILYQGAAALRRDMEELGVLQLA